MRHNSACAVQFIQLGSRDQDAVAVLKIESLAVDMYS